MQHISTITICLSGKFIYSTFANTDNKNIVRTLDCKTTRQNNCTYGSPLKHTNLKIAMNIITQWGTYKDQCTREIKSIEI